MSPLSILVQRQQNDIVQHNNIHSIVEELADHTRENLRQLEKMIRLHVGILSDDMRRRAAQNAELKEQMAGLTDLVGKLLYKVDMQETRVKTEEGEGNTDVKKEEVI
jgi:hypothetical protein